jgi:hypothetical protein
MVACLMYLRTSSRGVSLAKGIETRFSSLARIDLVRVETLAVEDFGSAFSCAKPTVAIDSRKAAPTTTDAAADIASLLWHIALNTSELRQRPPCNSPVAPDRLDRAFLERPEALGFLGGIDRLVEYVAAVFGIVSLEIVRRGLAAKIAVDARRVDVERPRDVFRHSFIPIRHVRFPFPA